MKATPRLLAVLAVLFSPLAAADVVSELTEKAVAGDATAQLDLAKIHAKGDGVAKNPAEAVKWYSMAAEQGSGEAQMTLASMFISGKGVRKSSTDAAKWYTMSALKGDAKAQCQLGRMHMTGAGVAKDDVEAYKWADLSSTQGDQAARKILSVLEARMTPVQVAEARQRARAFLDKDKPEAAPELPLDLPGDPVEQGEVPAVPAEAGVEPAPPGGQPQ